VEPIIVIKRRIASASRVRQGLSLEFADGIHTEVAQTDYLTTKMPTDPTTTALKLYVVLSRAAEAIHAHTKAHVEAHGLTHAEFAILEALFHKGPTLLGEVQKKILVSSGCITFLVDRLEKRKLVKRRPCENDRRARYAELTAAGQQLMKDIFPSHAEAIRRAVAGLGLADQRKAIELLKALGTEAAALDPQPPTPKATSRA
jgi:MarR family 2-MHQ and catechol resistance regulon transcriptional repressor